MRIVIFGATGMVGRRVVSEASVRGHDVVAVSRGAGAEGSATVATGTALLLVGGAGPLSSPDSPGVLAIDDERYVPARWRSSAVASLAQLQACEGHHAAWTYLSPPAVLEPGERTGAYRRGTTTLLVDGAGRSRISAEDLAGAVLDEVENPGPARHLTVAY